MPNVYTKTMTLKRWSVTHAYASYYLEEIDDLHFAAAKLVAGGIASVAYVADGGAFWLDSDGELRGGTPLLDQREHETHARIHLPEGIEGRAAEGLLEALCHRFSENKVVGPLATECHEYLRAVLDPSILKFGERVAVVFPTLKLYKTGVFVISYRMLQSNEPIDIPELVEDYVNVFRQWCDEALVPTWVAAAGVYIPFVEDEEAGLLARWRAKQVAEVMGVVPATLVATVPIGEYEYSFYPAHVDIEALLGDEQEEQDASGAGDASPSAPAAPTVSEGEAEDNGGAGDVDDSVEQDEPAAAPVQEEEAETSDEATGDDELPFGQSHMLSDLFDNAEFAARMALSPPRTGWRYVLAGYRASRFTRGGYWQSRPQVTVYEFDDQPESAKEVQERFGTGLGLIMTRSANAPAELARDMLGEDLRAFDDHSYHVSKSVTLCVYASREGINQLYEEPSPAHTEATDRAVLSEFADYVAMRCHQLEERTSVAKTVRDVRTIRTELGAVEKLARTAFRAGELNDAALVAWEKLELPELTREIREQLALAAEAAGETAQERAERFNVALALVFGLVGTAGLSDALTRPVWKYYEWPIPDGLEEPMFFGVSAVVVFLLLGLVTVLLSKR